MEKKLGIIQYIDEFLEDAEIKVQPFIVSGILNREYLKGNQNKIVDTRNWVIQEKKYDNKIYQERKTFNRMLPIYLTRYGILSSNRPIPGFKNQSLRSSSVNGAVEGNEFITEFSKEILLKDKYNELLRLADTDGLAWIKTGIDWTKGDLISTRTTKIKNTETNESNEVSVDMFEGREFFDVVPMHEVFVRTLTLAGPDKIQELVHRRVFTCEFIERKFGYRPPKEDLIGDFASFPYYLDVMYGSNRNVEYAYVKEYYKQPDILYPKGRFVIVVGNKVIHDGTLPYENAAGGKRTIPFIPVTVQSIPGHLVGPTVYNQIIPMQDTYNSVKNRLLEYVNHLAIGQLYYWEGSLVNKETFSNRPGKLIGLKRNSRPPQAVQKERIGTEIVTYLKTIEEDMLVTAGLSQMQAYGISQSNMRTDGVVDKIADSDSNKLTNAIDNLSAVLIKAFKQILYIEKYRQKLLLEEFGVANVDNYMLKYKLREVDPEDLEIINREFLMSSDITLEKKVAQAANLGIYNPQFGLTYRSKMELLDAINSGYLRDTLDPTQRANYELVLKEQNEFLELKSPLVEDFHDHDQHIVEHNLFRLSPFLQNMESSDKEKYDKIRGALDYHIGKHQELSSKSSQNKNFEDAKAYL